MRPTKEFVPEIWAGLSREGVAFDVGRELLRASSGETKEKDQGLTIESNCCGKTPVRCDSEDGSWGEGFDFAVTIDTSSFAS